MDCDDTSKESNLIQASNQPEDKPKPNEYIIATGFHICDLCRKEFANISNLNRHVKLVHKEDVLSVRAKIKCPSCEVCFEFYSTLCNHLKEIHSIQMERENLMFNDEKEFFQWKKKIENTTKSSFIKKCGHKKVNCKGVEKTYFYCHRAGEKFKGPTMGKRQIKSQGSCKINSGCPAHIILFKHPRDNDESPRLEVEYTKTHVGHTMDMKHIRLHYEDKAKLAAQLAKGVPASRILDSVNADGLMDRINLTTRRDLYNISKQFNIRTKNDRWNEDVAAIDAWVQISAQVNSGDILCYKPGGKICNDYPTLADDDFLLGIMNSYQSDMLKLYGNNLICVDATHLSSIFDFPLFTVMIVDETFEAFPVVFFISNRQDRNLMTVLFEKIKEQIGVLKPKVFIGDINGVFYNSWKLIMGPVDEILFCSWQVQTIWQRKLQMMKDIDDQQNAYKALNSLLNEPDPVIFKENLNHVLCDWQKNERFKKFERYFQQNFVNLAPFWATSLMKGCSNKTNLNLKKLGKMIKDVYFEDSVKVKAMDKALVSVIKLVGELEEKRNEKLADKSQILSLIIDKHEKSVNIDQNHIISVVTESQQFYLVISSLRRDIVNLVQANNESCDCNLICPRCNVCVHKYKCTCEDYSVAKNMCEHIHAVISEIKRENLANSVAKVKVENSNEQILLEDSEEMENVIEENSIGEQQVVISDDQDLLRIAVASEGLGLENQDQILISVFSSDNVASGFNQEKKILEDKVEELLSKIKTCSSWDELNALKNDLNSLMRD